MMKWICNHCSEEDGADFCMVVINKTEDFTPDARYNEPIKCPYGYAKT